MQRKKNRRTKDHTTDHLFTTNPEYLLFYLDMIKQEKYWRTQGQYYMARECQKRAYNLIHGNINEYNNYLKTENLYCPTRKSNLDSFNRV